VRTIDLPVPENDGNPVAERQAGEPHLYEIQVTVAYKSFNKEHTFALATVVYAPSPVDGDSETRR